MFPCAHTKTSLFAATARPFATTRRARTRGDGGLSHQLAAHRPRNVRCAAPMRLARAARAHGPQFAATGMPARPSHAWRRRGAPIAPMAQQVSTALLRAAAGLYPSKSTGSRGTFGTVYRAVEDGRAVAAKRFAERRRRRVWRREERQARGQDAETLTIAPPDLRARLEVKTDDALWLTTELGDLSLASLTWLKVEGEYTRVCGPARGPTGLTRGHLRSELFNAQKM